ncbi:MAG TPA: protein translocase subunit SecF, partial [Acidimicrobiales bacterium]|nr:protein translocase subunit SecF [Acidimicrobiales bacterium]
MSDGPGLAHRLYHGETSFDFVGRRRTWFALSGAVILIGLISLLVRGLNFGIDFKGGTVWEVPTPASISVAHVRDVVGAVSPDLRQAKIEVLTNRQNGAHSVRVEAEANATKDSKKVLSVTDALAKMAGHPTSDVTLNDVGASWGSDITSKAVRALVIFLVAVFVYITFRFERKMAIAAMVALVHDILVTAGIYSLSGFQVTPATVVAFLTILGYSLYDTIVVFDKIEENTKGLASSGRLTYTDTVNLSMNQVLMRSINTSLVAIMPILSILVIGSVILGASALQDFGLALFIGLLTGAYSSIFVASPLLAILKEREPRYDQIRQRLAGRASAGPPLTPAAAAAGGVLTPGAAQAGGSKAARAKAKAAAPTRAAPSRGTPSRATPSRAATPAAPADEVTDDITDDVSDDITDDELDDTEERAGGAKP